MPVYYINTLERSIVFWVKSFITLILFNFIFFWYIIRYCKRRPILALPIVLLLHLTTAFNSLFINTKCNNLTLVCAPYAYLMWLLCLRFSILCDSVAFIDFFGVSYSNGFFANISTFLHHNTTLINIVSISQSYTFFSGSLLFKGLEWYEREASDLCGCFFFHSVDRRVLLLPYCYSSHPLQKLQRCSTSSRTRGHVFLSFITWCNL